MSSLREIAEQIKSRLDIGEVIGAEVALRQAGRSLMGRCPFHAEKTPSLSVSRERGAFYCFGCGAGGSVIDFIMRARDVDFREAVEMLGERLGLSLDRRGESDSEQLFAANAVAARFFQGELRAEGGAACRAYLEQRGITGLAVETFRLGFAPPDASALWTELIAAGLSDAALRAGLFTCSVGRAPRTPFGGRLMFPIRDRRGRVLGFGARSFDGREPKYLNSAQSEVYSKGRCLYGLYEAGDSVMSRGHAVLVEGYIDVITLWQAGLTNALAPLGTAFSADQARALARLAPAVVACFDGDEAGRRAAERAIEPIFESGLKARVVFLPEGHDPDSFVREAGAPALESLVREATPLFRQVVENEARRTRGAAEMHLGIRRLAAHLGALKDPFERNKHAGEIAAIFGIDLRAVREVARPAAMRRQSQAQTASMIDPFVLAAESGILVFAFVFGDEFLKPARCADFVYPESRAVIEHFSAGCGLDAALACLPAELRSAFGARLGQVLSDPVLNDVENRRTVFEEHCDTLARAARARRYAEITQLLREAEPANRWSWFRAARELRAVLR